MVPSMTLTYLNLWQISRILVLVYPVFVMPQYLQCASSDKLVELTKANYPRAGNSTVWGECNLPNPRQRWELCGRHGPSWICDPDGLLSSEEADLLNQQLNETAMTSYCRCEDKCEGGGPRHATVLALVDWARVPNIADKSCEYGCASQVYPQLRPGSRKPMLSELNVMMDRITEHILLTWGLNRCDDQVVIFYTKHYDRVQVRAGSVAAARLGTNLHKALDAAAPYFSKGKLHKAFSIIISQYFTSLVHKNNLPQLVGITLAAIAGAIMLFGIFITIVYCRLEFKQGKNCKQICAGTMGGHLAFLFGGNAQAKRREDVSGVVSEMKSLQS